jgi:hypothetical protein
MRRALQPFAIAPQAFAVTIRNPNHWNPAFTGGRNHGFLRRKEPLASRKDHGTARFAKVVEHVNDENSGARNVEANRIVRAMG